MIVKLIPPVGQFQDFHDKEHYKQKVKEWGLSSAKEEFWYKEKDFQDLVTIKGYEIYGKTDEFNTVVIEFKDGSLSCIHPAYLKEMQQASFGKESMWQEGNDRESETPMEEPSKQIKTAEAKKVETKPSEPKKAKKEKAVKLELPNEKVHFSAAVKQFAMTYNSFTEENDEVVIFENVQIHQEQPITIEFAWCSYSKTLKKWELAIGDLLEFDGKITTKKLTKGKDTPEEFSFTITVPYKINNPSKLVKLKEGNN
ncbi:MAG: hypothetical protein Q8935_18215 [Bacillota bacterium]|nr:hypothetical protein [Bacillota bacterium]